MTESSSTGSSSSSAPPSDGGSPSRQASSVTLTLGFLGVVSIAVPVGIRLPSLVSLIRTDCADWKTVLVSMVPFSLALLVLAVVAAPTPTLSLVKTLGAVLPGRKGE